MKIIVTACLPSLTGSHGVDAAPMAVRVSDVEGHKVDATSYLLTHAIGPIVVGVVGIALLAGFFISAITL